jgi:hypothetical protein
MPAATDFMPSRTIAWASTVAVVVPSPAMSLVLEATSRSICAPMFSNLSLSSISLATVTPSLVMRGAPKLLSMTTLRPLGPERHLDRVGEDVDAAQDALARVAAEFHVFGCHVATLSFEYSAEQLRRFDTGAGQPTIPRMSLSFMMIRSSPSIFTSVPDHLPNRILSPCLDVERRDLAVFVAGAGADGDDFAFLRLFLGGVGNDDPAGGLFLGLDPADEHAVMKRPETHQGKTLRRLATRFSKAGSAKC